VKSTDSPAKAVTGTAVCCDVLACASAQATLDQMPALRQKPGPGVGQSLAVNFLKHADEQTVVGLAAVLRAIAEFHLSETRFTEWGVVAAPCFLGRATLVQALQRFTAEGAWGMSPHFIPHRSQHAISGTISQALKIHGPNFGAGGGPAGAVDAIVAGAVLVEGNRLPGVWVVLTGWEPEFIPDREGRPTGPAECRALALALTTSRRGWPGPQLRIMPGSIKERNGTAASLTAPLTPSLTTLLTTLGNADTPPTTVVWRLESGGWLEFRKGAATGSVAAATVMQRSRERGWAEVQQGGAGTENKR
jgi:hypothetical protein